MDRSSKVRVPVRIRFRVKARASVRDTVRARIGLRGVWSRPSPCDRHMHVEQP